jgi:SAM-dependent methyltransferase
MMNPFLRLRRWLGSILRLGEMRQSLALHDDAIREQQTDASVQRAKVDEARRALDLQEAEVAAMQATTRDLAGALRALTDEVRLLHVAIGTPQPDTGSLADRLAALTHRLNDAERAHAEASVQLTELVDFRRTALERILALQNGVSASRREFDALRMKVEQPRVDAPAGVPAGNATVYPMDRGTFERNFRGTRDDILERMRVYGGDALDAWTRTEGKSACDLGCGRGEWLELMRENGVAAFGIDANANDVAACVALGLDARVGDAIGAMRDAAEGSLGIVSAFHLVEHLSFADFALLLHATFRALAAGGTIVIETPNADNLLVGASTFHLDPTHVKPMPPDLLKFALADAGFEIQRTAFLHPNDVLAKVADDESWPAGIRQLLCGPQDFGVVARKPAA